ncbi:MAG: response regulator, partial [Planctomycetota bacterium]|nr:response regulator [Planctomycetota bacterium]
MRILIVDDDPLYRRILKRHVEKWGHEAVLAENGLEAWRIFQDERFPIVLTDWMMPEMAGPELIGRVREIETEEYVFIVLLTSKSEKEDIVDGMESGADDFLTKPVEPDELRVRLKAGQRVIELEHRVAERNAELEKMNERMQIDLNAAARIQEALLPSEPPTVPNARFAWSFQPCDELAGDTFNAIRLDENHIGLYLLDVSGHGVAAALLSVTLSRLLSPLSSANSLLKRPTELPPFYQLVPPAEVAAELNRRFPWDPGTRQFFTLVYGILDSRSTEFRYVCAGHPSPIHLTHGGGS